jgi:glycosyltransferase involved in cell wall biosynthesis
MLLRIGVAIARFIFSDADLRVAYRKLLDPTYALNNNSQRILYLFASISSRLGIIQTARKELIESSFGFNSAIVPNLSSIILDKIEFQSNFDPMILAVGAKALGSLPVVESSSVGKRVALNISELKLKIGDNPPDILIVIPYLAVGGAETYAAALITSFKELGVRRIAVIITDQSEADGRKQLLHSSLSSFLNVNLIFWNSIASPNDYIFARSINAINPKRILVINSRIGLNAINLSGNGLSCGRSIYAFFFSMGIRALGAPYGIKFPREIWSHTSLVTDNVPMQRQLVSATPMSSKVLLLRNRIDVADEATFEKRLKQREIRERNRTPDDKFRWVWVGRVDPLKGTDVLAEIAAMRPQDKFLIFGPKTTPLLNLGLSRPNVQYCGVLRSVVHHDFSDVDGFVFTSHFEGMPNTVLEMTQHAVPMVLAAVGGIAETFGDVAYLVQPDSSPKLTANEFDRVMNLIFQDKNLLDRIRLSYDKVKLLHSSESHRIRIKEIFEI